MALQFRISIFTILFFILTTINTFSGEIHVEGKFTFPFSKSRPTEEVFIDIPRREEKIIIANFNIQVFGKTKARKTDVMVTLAKIIPQFDIVAIQEIRDASGTAIKKLEHAVDVMGTDYEYIIGPRLGRTSSKEQYAFMYNTKTISVGESYTFDDSESDLFHRQPFIARFKTKKGYFDFILITIHTDPEDATKEINAIPIVLQDVQNQFPDEKDFIVLGDLNADCNYFDEDDQTSPLRSPEYKWLITNDMDTNLAESSCTYDRIIVTSATTSEDYADMSDVFRFDTVLGLTKSMAKKVSDHYPVYSVFYVHKDTD
ncbi:MAG: endonuclease/exonuclease/phosphatase family protein [Deltaproteobacteria bacterium]|jgi:endonuclease/exonuclease/phosphatase family metal-dependent hydrolase|nr:endonuclease/exonuclease/phosphatase family protein [Deltaproteobacteria bacterium]